MWWNHNSMATDNRMAAGYESHFGCIWKPYLRIG
jgi:hypothetical protein